MGTLMELKVWVDGVVRVVCGLSEETSCQDVVIALAQAIGMFILYVTHHQDVISFTILENYHLEMLI